MSSSPASSLPVEVWSQVFGDLEFNSLLIASHICRLIRSSAHAHPTFSRDIELLSLDNPEGLNLFRLRLRIGLVVERPISLNVMLRTLPSDSQMTPHREVLAEILTAMPRTTNLDLKCSTALESELRAVLEARAPRLRSLKVTLLDSPEVFGFTVPRGFLSNYAPELRSIEIDGLDFVEDETHHTFPSVQRIVCSGDSLELLPSLFPNLVNVVLGPREMDPNEFDDAICQFLLQVPQLTLNGNVEDLEEPSEEAIEFLAPRAEYTLQDVETTRLVSALQRLEGPLELQYSTLEASNHEVEVFRFTSRVDGKVRVFIDTGVLNCSATGLIGSRDPDREEILARVTHFSLTIGWSDEASILKFVQLRQAALQYLPGMTDLTIHFGGNSDNREESWPMPDDLKYDLDGQTEFMLAGHYSVEDPTIPFSNQLKRIMVVCDTSQVLSHEDAEGLVVVAGYLVQRIGDVEIMVGASIDVGASAQQILEANFLALNAAT